APLAQDAPWTRRLGRSREGKRIVRGEVDLAEVVVRAGAVDLRHRAENGIAGGRGVGGALRRAAADGAAVGEVLELHHPVGLARGAAPRAALGAGDALPLLAGRHLAARRAGVAAEVDATARVEPAGHGLHRRQAGGGAAP